MVRKAFTVNVPSETYAKEADYFGIVSGKDVDKFAATGLKAFRSEIVDAPYVEEFPLVLECKVIHTNEIGLHTQFVGEIMDVKADERVFEATGFPDIKRVNPIVYCPEIRQYYGIGDYIGQAYSFGKRSD